METAEAIHERVATETREPHADNDVLLRALLELAESAERNRGQSGSEAKEDSPFPEAA